MKKSERYSLALTAQLSGEKKNAWIPWASWEKQAGLYQGKHKSLGSDVELEAAVRRELC